MFRKILVPTDGSVMALAATRFARSLAEKFNSQVTLLHVMQNYYTLPSFSMPDTVAIPISVIQDMEGTGQRILAKSQEVFADYDGQVDTRLEFGPPGPLIVDIINSGKYELVVMGRRGLGGIAELLLGSVSNHVLHYANCPTLIVRNEVSP